jgi:hypothetical protein
MREEDIVILEEAIRNSAGGEDFDEMLLRATKKHLPRKYHVQFSVLLEDVLREADERGASNRSAAQALVQRPARPLKKQDIADEVLARHLGPQPSPAREEPPAPRIAAPEATAIRTPVPAPLKEEPAPAGAMTADAVGEPAGVPVEKLPEEQKILDLGGTSPDSLSPEMQEKLRKLVKAQKRRKDWEEGASDEKPDPGLFFKGQQRAPPFVPLGRPPKKDEKTDEKPAPAEKPAVEGEEEDLDGK